jgi:polysaccharide chain length determinant protein (PEP-CTERM system associated)
MTDTERFQLSEVRDLVWRRRWLMLAVLVVGAAASGGTAVMLPDVYEASTTIVIEAQNLPDAYPGSLSVPRLEERLRTAQTFLTSDLLLARVVTALDVVDAPGDPAAIEEAVEAVRSKLDVKVSGLDSFRLSLKGRDPERVMRIVNALAADFIAESAAYSERVMGQTAAFLQEERATIETRLRDHETRLTAFREQHRDHLPEHFDMSTRALDRLRERLGVVTRELREAREKAPILERQLIATPRSGPVAAAPAAAAPPADPMASRLHALQVALAEALAAYTEQHPEVRRLRREIREATALVGAPSSPLRDEGAPGAPSSEYLALAASVDLAKASVSALEREHADLVSEIRKEERRLDQIATGARQWAALTRDLETLKERHQLVLKKTFEADLSQKVGAHQADDRFRVLDPATLPTRPVGPRRGLVFVAGLVASVVLAVGAGWGVDRVIDTSLHSARSAEEALGVPVLAVVAEITVPDRGARP